MAFEEFCSQITITCTSLTHLRLDLNYHRCPIEFGPVGEIMSKEFTHQRIVALWVFDQAILESLCLRVRSDIVKDTVLEVIKRPGTMIGFEVGTVIPQRWLVGGVLLWASQEPVDLALRPTHPTILKPRPMWNEQQPKSLMTPFAMILSRGASPCPLKDGASEYKR